MSARCVLVLSLLLLATGCGSHGHAEESSNSTPAPDARSYSTISQKTVIAYTQIARRTETQLNASFDKCPVVQARDVSRTIPPESRFDVLHRAAVAKSFLPTYLMFAQRLRGVRTSDSRLIAARRAVATIAAYYRPLEESRPDYCETLVAWHAIGWAKPFDVAKFIGATRLTKRSPPSIQRARLALFTAEGRLRILGISETTARLFAELAGLPGTATP